MIDRDEFNKVWIALEGFRENCIPEGVAEYDNQWDDICTVMAKIEEELKIWECVQLDFDAMTNAIKAVNKDIREGL